MAARNPSKVLTNESLKEKLAEANRNVKVAKGDLKASQRFAKDAAKDVARDSKALLKAEDITAKLKSKMGAAPAKKAGPKAPLKAKR